MRNDSRRRRPPDLDDTYRVAVPVEKLEDTTPGPARIDDLESKGDPARFLFTNELRPLCLPSFLPPLSLEFPSARAGPAG